MSSASTVFRKTWKREAAVGLLSWLVGVISVVLYIDLAAGVELVKSVVVPFVGLAGAAFGAHVYQNTVAAQVPPYGPHNPHPPQPKEKETAQDAEYPFRPSSLGDH